MDELITRQQADALFLAIPVLGVVAAVVAFAAAKARGAARPVRAAVAWGAPPVLMGVLWPVYNAVADRLGLETVRNLFAVLGLFVLLGCLGGVSWSRIAGDPREATTSQDGNGREGGAPVR